MPRKMTSFRSAVFLDTCVSTGVCVCVCINGFAIVGKINA